MKPYGHSSKYVIGDTVRIWPVTGRPVGNVERVLDDEFPVKYRVSYTLPGDDDFPYVNDFEGLDLTLVEKRFGWECNCRTVTQTHLRWCNAAPKRK